MFFTHTSDGARPPSKKQPYLSKAASNVYTQNLKYLSRLLNARRCIPSHLYEKNELESLRHEKFSRIVLFTFLILPSMLAKFRIFVTLAIPASAPMGSCSKGVRCPFKWQYRTPEMLLDMPWDYSVNLWALTLMVYYWHLSNV